MLIIFHDKDLDGVCSAAILHHRYPSARLLGYDYGQPFDMNSFEPGEEVIMADVSLPMDKMSEIADKSGQFVWIDHHISASGDFIKYFDHVHDSICLNAVGGKLSYYFDNTISACESCWKFAFPGREMPLVVNLLGEYDTWRGYGSDKWNAQTLPFQYVMRVHGYTPESLSKIFGMDKDSEKKFVVDQLCYGKVIVEYQKQQNAYNCKKAFPARVNIEGQNIRAIVCNNVPFNSMSFDSVWDVFEYDVMCPIAFDGKTWGLSFYTTKEGIDCSVIAKHFGGGGHRAAAGVNGIDDLRKVLIF